MIFLVHPFYCLLSNSLHSVLHFLPPKVNYITVPVDETAADEAFTKPIDQCIFLTVFPEAQEL